MLVCKENVVVYTIQIDSDKFSGSESSNDIINMFKSEFEREGMTKEAELMDKGGFSFRETDSNSCYKEFKISITTRHKPL